MLQKNEQHFSAEHQKQKVPRKGNLWHEAQHRSREGHARWLRGRRSPSIRGVGKPGLLAPCFLRGGQLSAASCPHCRPFNSSPYRDTQRQSDASTDLFTAARLQAWRPERTNCPQQEAGYAVTGLPYDGMLGERENLRLLIYWYVPISNINPQVRKRGRRVYHMRQSVRE